MKAILFFTLIALQTGNAQRVQVNDFQDQSFSDWFIDENSGSLAISTSGSNYQLEVIPLNDNTGQMEVSRTNLPTQDFSPFDFVAWTQFSSSNYEGTISLTLLGSNGTKFRTEGELNQEGFFGSRLAELIPEKWTLESGSAGFAETISSVASIAFMIQAGPTQDAQAVRFDDIQLTTAKCLVTPIFGIPVEPDEIELVRFQEYVDLEITHLSPTQVCLTLHPLTDVDEDYNFQWSPDIGLASNWQTQEITVNTCCDGLLTPDESGVLTIPSTRNGPMEIEVNFPAGRPDTAYFRAETIYFDYSALFED